MPLSSPLLHPSSGRAWNTRHRRKRDQVLLLTPPSLFLRLFLILSALALLSSGTHHYAAAQSFHTNVTTPDTISPTLFPTATYTPSVPAVAFNSSTLPNATGPGSILTLPPVNLIAILPLFNSAQDYNMNVEPAFSSTLQQLGRQGVVITYIAAAMFNAHSTQIYTAAYNGSTGAAAYTLNFTLSTSLIVADEGCDPTIAVPNLITALDLPNTDSVGVIGPACSAATQPAAIIASYYGLPSISYAATSDDLDNKATYPTFFRTAADLASEVSCVVPIMQQYGWRNLLVVVAEDILQEGVLDDLIAQMSAAQLSITEVQSYTTGQTSYSNVQPVLASLAATYGNVYLLYGDNVTDCIAILAVAYNESLLNSDNIWIVHPNCAINTALNITVTSVVPDASYLADNVTVAMLMAGQLYYVEAVQDVTSLLYQSVSDSYYYLLHQGHRIDPNVSLPNASIPLMYNTWLAFDTTISYLLAFQGMLRQAIIPSRANDPLLVTMLGRLMFRGVTGLVNYSSITGRRLGEHWSLQQVDPATNEPLTLGFLTLSGELTIASTDTTQVATTEPYSVLALTAGVAPVWLGGSQPRDALIHSSSSAGTTAGIIVGAVIGGLLVCFCCVLCVGVARRNIQRNANILREAKDEAIRAQLEAENADRQKSQFLSTMSHEIRTPMNGVIGYGQLLSSSGLSPEQIEYVEGITVSTDHLLTVINDILDFHSVERGEMEIEYSVVRLQQVVEQAVNIAYRPAFSSHLEVLTFIDPSLPDVIIGDTTRLRQILANLLSNSLKFPPSTTGQIRIVMCKAGEKASIRELVPFPIVPMIEGMWAVGEGRWEEDVLDEARVGRVEADISGIEREKDKGEREDQERLERMREEHKMKKKIRSNHGKPEGQARLDGKRHPHCCVCTRPCRLNLRLKTFLPSLLPTVFKGAVPQSVSRSHFHPSLIVRSCASSS